MKVSCSSPGECSILAMNRNTAVDLEDLSQTNQGYKSCLEFSEFNSSFLTFWGIFPPFEHHVNRRNISHLI